ncbi:13558_t:CDS:1 [Acaulospora colombiana]|uniref:13558_t:CDS:1 n=1 Tax=Acaulospora colombiana TaxID=27376 RepID=A0ACA9LKY4_9GLOM|nr:13558_t:CDS:1 [Acaulospora colombiana]
MQSHVETNLTGVHCYDCKRERKLVSSKDGEAFYECEGCGSKEPEELIRQRNWNLGIYDDNEVNSSFGSINSNYTPKQRDKSNEQNYLSSENFKSNSSETPYPAVSFSEPSKNWTTKEWVEGISTFLTIQERRLKAKQRRIEYLLKEIERNKNENSELNSRIKFLENGNNRMASQLYPAHFNQDLPPHLDFADEELFSSFENIEMTPSPVENRESIDDLSRQIEKHMRKEKESQEADDDLRTRNEILQKQIVNHKKKEKELQEEIDNLRTRNEGLEKQIENNKKALQEVETNNEILEKHYMEKEKALQEKVDELKAKNVELEKQNEEEKANVSKLRSTNNVLVSSIQTPYMEAQNLLSLKIRSLETTNRDLENKIEILENELKNEPKILKGENENLKKKIKLLETDLKEEREKVVRLERERIERVS